jgi:hypothetical protein
MIHLLDVNVLVALFDPAHVGHELAHAWWERHRREGWATCPPTVNGFVRVLSSAAYPTARISVSQAVELIRIPSDSGDHHFWPDGPSLADPKVFRWENIAGPKQITDVYLLAVAMQHGGRLVTFDRSIPWRAVQRGSSESLLLLS